MSWLHVERWYIDHRQSFDRSVHQNTDNFCSRVEWPWSGSSSQRSFIYFMPSYWQCVSIFLFTSMITLKNTVCEAHLERNYLKKKKKLLLLQNVSLYVLAHMHRYSSLHIFVGCIFIFVWFFWYALLETHISIFLSQIFPDIIYTCLACGANTVCFVCCECMYMLCQGLVCPRINVFEVNYLERLLAGPSSLCVSKSRYWFLRYRINAARNTAHSILVSTWYVPLAPLRFNTLKQESKLSLFSSVGS